MTSPRGPHFHTLVSSPQFDYEYLVDEPGPHRRDINNHSLLGYFDLVEPSSLTLPHHSTLVPHQEGTMERAPKRRRLRFSQPLPPAPYAPTGQAPMPNLPESIDMTTVDDLAGLFHLQAEQRRRHAETTPAGKPAADSLNQQERGDQTSISGLQCVVCMETMTNMTVTYCGERLLSSSSTAPICANLVRTSLLLHMLDGGSHSRRESRV